MNAEFTRRGQTVYIPLDDSGGGQAVARDIGKPNLDLQTNGRINPRSSDQWSALENFRIFGQFTDLSTAYDDAIKLADIVKSAQGEAATLNIPKGVYDDDISVVPLAEQEQALQITYPPGRRRWVDVQLGLTRVSQVNGSGEVYIGPTASGSGPIQIDDGTNTVDLTADIEVTRTVGRPNSTVRRSTFNYPIAIEKRKSAYDAFELSLEFVDGDVSTKVDDLINMFQTRQRRSDLTLDFNGVFGLGSFDVMPEGSNALRQVEPIGQTGPQLIPTVNLRVVDNS